MKWTSSVLLALLLCCGCGPDAQNSGPGGQNARRLPPPPPPPPATGAATPQHESTLVEARRGFPTKLVARSATREPVDEPPATVFRKVQYDAPAGKLAAYLTLPPQDGKKHPAITWIVGGDCNSIGDVWSPAPASNDQSARAFREAGIVMMFPSLRGGNQNPGVKEGFLGEVDDVLAAADFLARQDYVDPGRVYMGGHSTGGTMAMLVAESSPRFRAVFSFGPVAVVAGYPPEFLPFDTSDPREFKPRSPAYWLHCVQTPLFVLEGAEQGNIDSLQAMARMSSNSNIHFHPVPRATHFTIIAPATRLIAAKILQDNGTAANIAFSDAELDRVVP
jgi:dipeptidyl aminopeptidase/acylaminoacyl peptidase